MALWMFGGLVEQILGSRRFLLAYLGSGIAGGLLQALLMTAFPRAYSPIVVGASAGLEGLFAIFALIHRDAVFNVMFVLPVRAITLYYFAAGVSIFFTLIPSGLGGGIAHGAHLGGLLFGTLWYRLGWHHDYQPLPGQEMLERLRARWFQKSSPTGRRTGPGPTPGKVKPSVRWEATVSRPPKSTAASPVVDLSQEVDPILDKIAQHGMHSLTPAERQKLDEVRRKMTGQ